MHLDPCEAAHDNPLLYDAGWGKKLDYIIAVGRRSAADVTRCVRCYSRAKLVLRSDRAMPYHAVCILCMVHRPYGTAELLL